MLLVDRTTQYDETDQDELVGGLEDTVRSIGTGDRVSIRTISDSPAHSELLFDACKPGCPDSGLLGDLWSECRPIVARQRALGFRADILRTLQGVVTDLQQHDHSAILDTVSTVAAERPLDGGTRLLIFSDLLENSPELPWPAITRSEPDALVAQLRSRIPAPDLDGVTVEVFGFGRDHTPARTPLSPAVREATASVWRGIFLGLGASDVTIGADLAER